MLRVEHETGRLYTVTELAEPTSLSGPVEVNHTTEAQYLLQPTMTAIISEVMEVHQATPKVGVEEETHIAVHTTSQGQQPAERLAQCIANLASSVYDGGGRPVEAALKPTMTDIISAVLEVHQATPKVGVEEETHLAVHMTSQVQQLAERLARCIANLASSVYDGGGRPVEAALSSQSEDKTQLRNIINVVGTTAQREKEKKQYSEPFQDTAGQGCARCRGSLLTTTGGNRGV